MAIDLAIVDKIDQIPRAVVPDMPDRIIAVTGLVHNLPVVTKDADFRASAVATIW